MSTTIPCWTYRFSSDLRSQAAKGPVSTKMGDPSGIPGVVGFLLSEMSTTWWQFTFCRHSLNFFLFFLPFSKFLHSAFRIRYSIFLNKRLAAKKRVTNVWGLFLLSEAFGRIPSPPLLPLSTSLTKTSSPHPGKAFLLLVFHPSYSITVNNMAQCFPLSGCQVWGRTYCAFLLLRHEWGRGENYTRC